MQGGLYVQALRFPDNVHLRAADRGHVCLDADAAVHRHAPRCAPIPGKGCSARAEEILAIVEGQYYQDVDEETLETAAIDGMLAALGDPYTFYYTNEAYTAMNEETTGQYSGVGMLVGEAADGTLAVLRVFHGSPAEEAGIEAGDVLYAIDGVPVNGEDPLGLGQASALLKGDGSATVDVDVLRDGGTLSFTLTRGEVNINYVEYSILGGNVGYLSIYQFTGDDVTGVKEAISAFQQAGVTALVVDVRSNPGGLLDDVVDICDMLLPEGLIVYTEDRQGAREEFYADAEYWDVPMAVLVERRFCQRLGDLRCRRTGHGTRRGRGRNDVWQGHRADALFLPPRATAYS